MSLVQAKGRLTELSGHDDCFGWTAFFEMVRKYYLPAEYFMRRQLLSQKGNFADVKEHFNVLIQKLQYQLSRSSRYKTDADDEIETLTDQLVIVARTRCVFTALVLLYQHTTCLQ